MMIRGTEIAARTIAMVLGIVLLVGAISFGLYQCGQRRNEGAQSKMDSAQSGAASNSAADAINTVSGAGQREAGSEELTRQNERDIRAAEGAAERIKPGVDYAGRKALCSREVYREDPRCEGMKQ